MALTTVAVTSGNTPKSALFGGDGYFGRNDMFLVNIYAYGMIFLQHRSRMFSQKKTFIDRMSVFVAKRRSGVFAPPFWGRVV